MSSGKYQLALKSASVFEVLQAKQINKQKPQSKQTHSGSRCWRASTPQTAGGHSPAPAGHSPGLPAGIRSKHPELAPGRKRKLLTVPPKRFIGLEPYMGESNNFNRKQKKKKKGKETFFAHRRKMLRLLSVKERAHIAKLCRVTLQAAKHLLSQNVCEMSLQLSEPRQARQLPLATV